MQSSVRIHKYLILGLTLDCEVGDILILFAMGELFEEWDLTTEHRLSMSSANPA